MKLLSKQFTQKWKFAENVLTLRPEFVSSSEQILGNVALHTDPLVSKRCNATFSQICFDKKQLILDGLRVSPFLGIIFEVNVILLRLYLITLVKVL